MRFKLRGPLIGWESLTTKSKKNEPFIDTNKNNKYDFGEEFEDIGNGIWNTNEKYEDLNNNNSWDENETFFDKGNGVRDNGQNVVIVEIDDESYKLICEGYPYTRGRVWSEVVKNLTNADARLIVFDIMFDSPDHTTKIINNAISDNCENCIYTDADIEFSNSILYAKKNGTDVILASKIGYDINRIPTQYYVNPYKTILDAGPYLGLIDQESDMVDNVIRRYPIYNKIINDSEYQLSLATRSALVFNGIIDFEIINDIKNNQIKFNDFSINTYSNEASFLINYNGPNSNIYQTFDTFSLSNIIDSKNYDLCSLDEDDDWMDKYTDKNNPLYRFFGNDKNPFRDKIVIIGSSLQEDNDFVQTPYFNYNNSENPMPGVEVHANAIQQLLDSDFIEVPTKTLSLSRSSFAYHILIIFTFIFITLLLSNIKFFILSIISVLLLIISWFSFSIGSFLCDQLWLVKTFLNLFLSTPLSYNYPNIGQSIMVPVVLPIGSILITYGINLSYKLFKEQSDKNFLKDTFGKYVSPKLIDDMYTNKKLPELGGESGIRTAFFSDLQSFSTISEQLSSKELVDLLNEFLSSQTEIILNNKGTLDKYEGDAILSFFGAPLFFETHAKAAIDSGVSCQNNLVKLCEKWKSEGDKWPEIVHGMKMRIGVNTGEMVTGNMGSKHFMNYTMMGDVVNIAARLESAAKQYGIFFHTTEETLFSASEHDYSWRYIDRVQFVGKTVWHQTVEILGFKKDEDERIEKLTSLFNKALKEYYNQNWDKAIVLFEKSNKYETNNNEEDINPSKIFIDRSYEFKRYPPRSGWRGAFILVNK
tara:strand:- start:6665 stop:9115 length:2451 start_codon:yes stop_codon:yes gene_type:complete